MKKLLFLLMLVTVAATAAIANNGDKRNNGDKPGKGAKAKTANVNRLEEFIWTLPQSQSQVEKVDDCEMQKAMVDLYKWYLQNETRINNSPVLTGDDHEAVVAPFKVDPKVLQQYLKFIKKNFPGLNEDDLTDKHDVSATKKKSAPVSYRDDLDAPISVTASK